MPESPIPPRYWSRVLRTSLEEISKTAVLSAAAGAMLAALIAALCGFAKKEEVASLVFIAAAGAVCAVLMEFLIRFLIISPRNVFADVHDKHQKAEAELRDLKNPFLVIEGVECEIISKKTNECHIRIRNKSIKTAYGVSVEIIGIGHPVSPWSYSSGSFPATLVPVEKHEMTINPGDAREWYFLEASLNGTDGVYAGLFTDEGHSGYLNFKMDVNYSLEIKALARDIPAIEQTLNLMFSGQTSVCRFTLTKT